VYQVKALAYDAQNKTLLVQTQSSKAFIYGIRIRVIIITKCYNKSN